MGTRKLYEMLEPLMLEQQIKMGKDFVIGFDTDIFRESAEENLFSVLLKVDIQRQSDEFIFAEIIMKATYRISTLDKIPDNLFEALLSVTFSTTRGILFSKLSATYLQSVILPLIDPGLLFQNFKEKHKESEKKISGQGN
jgi:hypothetical protein